MTRSLTLFLLVLITLTTVYASSTINRNSRKGTLSIATALNGLGTFDVVEKDRARIQAMIQGGHLKKRGASTSSVIANNTFVSYTAEVGIGTPPTYYTLIIDTGSSNTWVGAGKPYVKTNSSQNTGHAVSVAYGNGSFSGYEWNDTVTLSPDLVITQQSIGVANISSSQFSGVNGILGVGPVALTAGSVNGVDTVPTVMGNLFSQGRISQEVLGIYFVPSFGPSGTGELTFGGFDESATLEPVVYAPLTKMPPESQFWGINASIGYGLDPILPSTAGIVDTGSTLTYIATDAFKQYQSKTGATLDNTTGLLRITSDQYERLEPLVFNVGDNSKPLVLTPNAQIWPRSLNQGLNGSADAIYLVINDVALLHLNFPIGFIKGFTFLQRYYSVYDATNQRVGFAPTVYTFSESN